MENESVKIVGDWLGHATYGIGAQLVTLTRISGDPLPATPTIVTQRGSGAVARLRAPKTATTGTVLVASMPVGELSDGIPTRRFEGRTGVLVEYLLDEVATETATIAAGYVNRAIRWSLLDYHHYSTSATNTVNGITLQGLVSVTPYQRDVDSDDRRLLAGQLLTFDVTDER